MIDNIIENLSQFHFLRPTILIFFILPIAFWLLFMKQKTQFSSWEKACDSNLLKYLLIKNNSGNHHYYGRKLFFIGLIISVLAAAGPTWKKRENPILMPQNPIMFLLNLSSDMQQTDISPNRLSRAKLEISDILKSLPDVESGLIVYTSEPFLISPLSRDSNLLINLLDSVSEDIMPVNGDNLARAIDFAVEKIHSAGFGRGNIVILAAEAGIDGKLSVAAAQQAVSSGVTVSVMAFSSKTVLGLKEVAQNGQGVFIGFPFGNTQKLVDYIKQRLSNELEKSKNFTQSWQDYGYFLVFPAMLCFLFLFRRSFFILFLVFCIIPSAEAGWFWNDEYEALKLFKLKKYEQSADLFKNKDWRGVAFYRAGNYEAAIQNFSDESNVESLYNKGNALAKSGKIEEAIATYEDVLKKQPKHDDAKFNLNYLKQQKQQQQKQNKNNQQNQDNKEQNQQQSTANSEKNDGKQQNKQNLSENEETFSQSDNNQNTNNNVKDENKKDVKSQSISQSMQKESMQLQEKKQDIEPDNEFGVSNEKSQDDKYDEQVQAREQRYRDIPEDKGGLLRAFIKKEYNKNRYGE